MNGQRQFGLHFRFQFSSSNLKQKSICFTHDYYEGQVQNTKCIYSLQIKPLTRQGDEDKIRYFYRKGGISWSSCNYGIYQWEIQATLIENQLSVGPPTGACDMKSPAPFFQLSVYTFIFNNISVLFTVFFTLLNMCISKRCLQPMPTF